MLNKLTADALIFVCGLSGAGRSCALKIFEDLGYSAIDNLPLDVVPALLSSPPLFPLVMGLDCRAGPTVIANFTHQLKTMRENRPLHLVFLDCQDSILVRRYGVTRRRHPIEAATVRESITQERTYLTPLRQAADHVIDTSEMSIVTLGRILKHTFALQPTLSPEILCLSFSYRHGLPQEADLVFDARFLTNPHYEPDLQALTGLDESIKDFIRKDSNWPPLFYALQTALTSFMAGVKKTGRPHVTIAVGCTGGRHRSVFMVQELASYLKKQGESVQIEHRDLKTDR